MTKPKPKIMEQRDRSLPLSPNEFVRLKDGHLFFGLGMTQIYEHIRSKSIPPLISITDSDASSARGWFGKQILEWQEKRLAAAQKPKKRAAA